MVNQRDDVGKIGYYALSFSGRNENILSGQAKLTQVAD
ncbi:hypothetical protein P873_10170 [Arenimonas composti TR7-09 = DSM 18010]|uniref:Uncharacterized protein n=1 Tax=Arenimonas composti TR7-09 = DSM 18010 TaxID=1121013 RepID=A0A091BYT2_9GAMM|nr:hypothetical protein P873_10170 [Arenimonas composti TR7-09 = DSM 18010]